ncbi:MAG: hypothetical protein J6X18_08775 [Bacteroidales bacterium]|nr:hypothetical protein [Bacteroidales bacterium]
MSKEDKKLFTASEGMKQEYCAEIVRMGEMKPIEGSDFLVQTIVDGFSIVVSKGEFTEGEPVIYCMNETALNKDFLSVNNQFEIGLRDMNANASEVNAIMSEYDTKYKFKADELREKAKQLKGNAESMSKAAERAAKTLKKIEKEYETYSEEKKAEADAEKQSITEKIERLTNASKSKTEEYNALKKEIERLVNDGKHIVDEAKKHVGFFNKYGRVKLIELRGCPSYGVIFKKETLEKWNKKVANENLEDYLTVDENGYEHPFMFDTVGSQLFAEAYVPPILEVINRGNKKARKMEKRYKTFHRVIPGEMCRHYETIQLKQNMWKIKPESKVLISTKLHGTSIIIGNVLGKIPNHLTSADLWYNRNIKKKIRHIKKSNVRNPYTGLKNNTHAIQVLTSKIIKPYHIDYTHLYSSRNVVVNDEIGKTKPNYYEVDLYTEYGKRFAKYLDKGMTLYGEICGYETDTNKCIQRKPDYDYGCEKGKNFLMPYRITWKHEDGTKSEWNVEEVYGWTLLLMKEHPELAQWLHPIDILYHGTMKDLYPDLDVNEHWHTNVLERMINDTEHFGMELDEPLCNNKVPREGICIRIDDDPIAECFKLKTFAFLKKEQVKIDAGEVDVEMSMAYRNQ